MKKIIFPLLLIWCAQKAGAQCTEPFTIPYTATTENATVPGLPDCMDSTYMTFDSDEVFTSIAGPVAGFEGKLLAYNTVTASQGGGAMSPTVGANLYTHEIQLEQGIQYVISYRYKNSDATKTINSFGVRIQQPATGFYLDLSNHLFITGGNVTNFTSQPFIVPATGAYSFDFLVQALGNQGFLYLDNITVQQANGMGIEDNSLSDIFAYPNPTSGRLTISGTNEFDRVEVYSLTGQLLYSQIAKSLLYEIDINKYAAGTYLVHIYCGKGVKRMKVNKY
jgi:hypothetical protein